MDPRHADLLTDAVEEAVAALPRAARAAWIEAAARGYEAARRAADRSGAGRAAAAWYTPEAVVEAVLDDAWPGQGSRPAVVDPACGTGHFLVAAGSRMRRGRPGPSTLHGMDLDPMAVAIARVRLRHRFGGNAAGWRRSIRCGDALAPDAWRRTFDLVVGNPPFLGQLTSRSARSARERTMIAERFDGLVRRYADAAAAFLLLSTELAPAGTAALVLPVPLLATADARSVRAAAVQRLGLRAIRILPPDAFAAAVRTCIVTLGRPAAGRVRIRSAAGWTGALPAAALGADWGAALAAAQGVPPSGITRGAGTLAAVLTATADFRQHYYGLRGLVEDARGARPSRTRPALVTVGAIDAARLAWGERPVRIHGRAFAAPVVRCTRLRRHAALGPWLAARAVPKVLVATQTRAIEAWVDATATTLPSTPAITVVPRRHADLWRVGAAILAPPVAAEAWWRHAGAGMSTRAIRISAAQLRAMPAPGDRLAWNRGAAALRAWQSGRAGARDRFARAMCDAYGVRPGAGRAALLAWWTASVER
jgi:tRNA1(Val) A37 N6-methylase TrmN6